MTDVTECPVAATTDGDELVHWVCCDTDLTLCGRLVPDGESVGGMETPEPTCLACGESARAGCCPIGCPCPLGPLP